MASGPAATIAARCQSGLRLKARSSSAGATVAFALVEHAHVAAEGQRADDELGAVGPRLAAPEDAAEADREAQHLDAAGDGDPVVAVLVDDDEDAERQEESEDGDHHQRSSVARSCDAPTGSGLEIHRARLQELAGAPARLVVEREQRLERVGSAGAGESDSMVRQLTV